MSAHLLKDKSANTLLLHASTAYLGASKLQLTQEELTKVSELLSHTETLGF